MSLTVKHRNISIVIFVVLFCGYYFLSNYGVGKSLGYGFIIAVLYFILAALLNKMASK
jgi:hypothetical protein